MATQVPSEAVVAGQAQYEFTAEQNRVIADLEKKMRLVGIVLQIFGVLGTIAGLLLITRNGIGALIQGVISLCLGIWTVRAADAFRRIVTTEGQDISNLMAALQQLGRYFGLKYMLIMIGLVLMAVVLGFVLLALLFGVGAGLVK
jgi:hypothetical protein